MLTLFKLALSNLQELSNQMLFTLSCKHGHWDKMAVMASCQVAFVLYLLASSGQKCLQNRHYNSLCPKQYTKWPAIIHVHWTTTLTPKAHYSCALVSIYIVYCFCFVWAYSRHLARNCNMEHNFYVSENNTHMLFLIVLKVSLWLWNLQLLKAVKNAYFLEGNLSMTLWQTKINAKKKKKFNLFIIFGIMGM